MIDPIDIEKVVKEQNPIPVTSPQIFFGKTFSFHPQGLMSEEIFGAEGTKERQTTISYIDLNCQVIHPIFYDIISKKLNRKIPLFLSQEKEYEIEEEGKLVEVEEGMSGYRAFIKNLDKIKFLHKEEETHRKNLIELILNNIKGGTFFISKLIVIPPEYRPVIVLEKTNEVQVDPLNELYTKILGIANQQKEMSGDIYDILSWQIQLQLKELYELIRVRTSKKGGIIRNQMLGKRVDFSARGVITPDPTLKLGEVGVPLVVCISIFEPNLIYGILNSEYSSKIPEEFHKAVKEFLGKEMIEELQL